MGNTSIEVSSQSNNKKIPSKLYSRDGNVELGTWQLIKDKTEWEEVTNEGFFLHVD